MNRLLIISFVAMAALVTLGSSSPSPIRQSIFTVGKYRACYKELTVEGCINKEMLGKNIFNMDYRAVLSKCKDSVKQAILECKKLYGQN